MGVCTAWLFLWFQFLIGRLKTIDYHKIAVILSKKFQFLIGRLKTNILRCEVKNEQESFNSL